MLPLFVLFYINDLLLHLAKHCSPLEAVQMIYRGIIEPYFRTAVQFRVAQAVNLQTL